ncbi:MAG TPA: adenylyl-sulfate kinase, partial [Micromonosporaceae bacterium]|nr:adenylyl-sulfate kinase [Micromonosporaceae bacterium]
MNGWALPDELIREAPTYAPSVRELADLELLLLGALAPLSGFHTRADLESIAETGKLADGTPWPVPVTLTVPADLVSGLDTANPLKRVLVLTDPEGAPVAALDAVDVWPVREGWSGVGGPVRRIGESGRGSFRRLRLSPEEVRATLPP